MIPSYSLITRHKRHRTSNLGPGHSSNAQPWSFHSSQLLYTYTLISVLPRFSLARTDVFTRSVSPPAIAQAFSSSTTFKASGLHGGTTLGNDGPTIANRVSRVHLCCRIKRYVRKAFDLFFVLISQLLRPCKCHRLQSSSTFSASSQVLNGTQRQTSGLHPLIKPQASCRSGYMAARLEVHRPRRHRIQFYVDRHIGIKSHWKRKSNL